MASIESFDPKKSNEKSDSNVRLISLSSEVNFDWSLVCLICFLSEIIYNSSKRIINIKSLITYIHRHIKPYINTGNKHT